MASAVVHLRHGMAVTVCRYRAQRGRDTSRRCLSLGMPHHGMTECGFYVEGNGFVVSAVFFYREFMPVKMLSCQCERIPIS